MEVKNGHYLLATEKLKGSFFEDSVIYLANASPEEGVYGFIINRKTHMPVAEVFSGIPKAAWRQVELFVGGPVAVDEVQILRMESRDASESNTFPLKENLAEESLFLDQILEDESTKLFLGYSGWTYEQLQDELNLECWVHIDTLAPLFLFENSEKSYQVSASEFQKLFC